MTATIIDKVVHGGPAYKVPADLNFGRYLIDKLRQHSTNPDAIAFVSDCLCNLVKFLCLKHLPEKIKG